LCLIDICLNLQIKSIIYLVIGMDVAYLVLNYLQKIARCNGRIIFYDIVVMQDFSLICPEPLLVMVTANELHLSRLDFIRLYFFDISRVTMTYQVISDLHNILQR